MKKRSIIRAILTIIILLLLSLIFYHVSNKKVDINDFSEYISKKHNINLDSEMFAKFIK